MQRAEQLYSGSEPLEFTQMQNRSGLGRRMSRRSGRTGRGLKLSSPRSRLPCLGTRIRGISSFGCGLVRQGISSQRSVLSIRKAGTMGTTSSIWQSSHYLELTGPVEHWGLGSTCTYETRGDELDVQHLPQIPEWLKDLGQTVLDGANTLGAAPGRYRRQRKVLPWHGLLFSGHCASALGK